MRIVLGADHAGFRLKQHLSRWLRERGHVVLDVGCAGEERVDYPDFAHAAGRMLASGEAERGVLVCGSGIGMAMAANRHAGVRAANCVLEHQAELTRRHNDANVLCLGERLISPPLAEAMLETFLATPFEGGRHQARIAKIERDAD